MRVWCLLPSYLTIRPDAAPYLREFAEVCNVSFNWWNSTHDRERRSALGLVTRSKPVSTVWRSLRNVWQLWKLLIFRRYNLDAVNCVFNGGFGHVFVAFLDSKFCKPSESYRVHPPPSVSTSDPYVTWVFRFDWILTTLYNRFLLNRYTVLGEPSKNVKKWSKMHFIMFILVCVAMPICDFVNFALCSQYL